MASRDDADMASRHDADAFDDSTMEMLSANLPSNAFASHTPDPRLERARQETERTNQITPLLKEELRLRILSKRLEKGEPEIELSLAEPRSYELTEEERAKRERRKAQNRRAAKKCREKRKMKTLSDAEKYRLVRDENQQLRNDVTYLKHKEAVFREYCIEHILNGQCPVASSDEPVKRILALLGPNMKTEGTAPRQAPIMATLLWSRSPQNQGPARSSELSRQVLKNEETCTNVTIPLHSTAAQAVYQAEQSVTAIQELKVLPVHEISSLLPTEPDFSGSDHSLESNPPDLSPTSLFNAMSPTPVALTSSGGASSSFFNQLTPSTSFSSNNTSSFSSSNDDIPVASHSACSILVNSSFADSISSIGQTSPDMSAGYLQEGPHYHLDMFRKVHAVESYGELNSTPVMAFQKEQNLCHLGDPNLNSMVSCDLVKPNGDGHDMFSATATNNTAYFNDLHPNLDSFINHYLKTEQIDGVSSIVSRCEADLNVQTAPDSPLSPVSLSSHHVSLSPRSPCSISLDGNYKDCSSTQFQPTGVSLYYNSTTPTHDTAASHVVGRTSSTTSVPSPHSNHQVSITLSPPPSVPSPNSNGVPESPSILPHFSPVSSGTSDDCSPARFYDPFIEDMN